jgi:ABC-type oligopeptide transport system substrate-binding subunit
MTTCSSCSKTAPLKDNMCSICNIKAELQKEKDYYEKNKDDFDEYGFCNSCGWCSSYPNSHSEYGNGNCEFIKKKLQKIKSVCYSCDKPAPLKDGMCCICNIKAELQKEKEYYEQNKDEFDEYGFCNSCEWCSSYPNSHTDYANGNCEFINKK